MCPEDDSGRKISETLTSKNGWREYQRLVLGELKRMNTALEKLEDKFQAWEVQDAKDKTTLYLRTGIISVIVGAIPATLVLVGLWIRNMLSAGGP